MKKSKKWITCSLCAAILMQVGLNAEIALAKEKSRVETEAVSNLTEPTSQNNLKIDSQENVATTVNQQKSITKRVPGRGDVDKEYIRMRSYLKLSNVTPTGLYAKVNDRLVINYSGNKQNLKLRIGIEGKGPNDRDTEQTFPITKGVNQFVSKYDGAIFIINPNDGGEEELTFSGMSGQMPYFELGKTSDTDFNKQMQQMPQAKDVQLVSKRAMITVRYNQVKKHLNTSPTKLMENLDRLAELQDGISGISPDYRKEHQPTKLLHHYIDTYKAGAYMDATYYRMRFSGTDPNGGAVKTLLDVNSSSRWGIWHETGHQRQINLMRWSAITEVTVNLYSLAAEREFIGNWNRIKPYYKNISEYMDKPIEKREYEKLDAFEKLIMFAQLWNTFGDDFYPILHQMYREAPNTTLDEGERRQLLIVRISEITGWNMIPFFQEWGYKVEQATWNQLSNLPTLKQFIWKNDDKNIIKMPVKLVKSVQKNTSNITATLVSFDANPFKNYDLLMKKNGQTIAELKDGVPQNSTLNGDKWKINQGINSTDHLSIIAVDKAGEEYSIYPQIENPEIDKIPPTVPNSLTAPEPNITSDSINLIWKPSIDNVFVSHYNIFRDGVKIGISKLTLYKDSNLDSGTTYRYQVSAVDTSGNESAKSNALSVSTKGEPNIPPLPEAPQWNSNTTYTSGQLATYKKGVFKAKWWNRGSNPDESDAWQLVSGKQNWSAKKAYQRGEQVVYEGVTYEAQQWTQGQRPSNSNHWKVVN